MEHQESRIEASCEGIDMGEGMDLTLHIQGRCEYPCPYCMGEEGGWRNKSGLTIKFSGGLTTLNKPTGSFPSAGMPC